MGSKGGGGSSSSGYSAGTSTTTLPDWLNSASQSAVNMAQGIANTPYTPYLGQLVADTPAATQQAYQQVYNMQGMGMGAYGQDINAWTGMLGQVNPLTASGVNQLSNQLYGNYNQNVTAPVAGLLGNYLANASPATAQQVGSNAMQLMTPYEAAVINPSMQAGQQALAQNLQQIGAGANQSGAFGGSRQAVQEGVAQAQTSLGESQQIANLLNQGWQSSLTPAYNLASGASQQGYGAANTLASLMQGGYNAAQQQGQNLAGTNLSAGLTAAQQLPGALTSQQTAAQQQASLLQTVGAAQQQQQQAELNAQYGQFLTAQQYPYQQLDTLLSAVGSVPYGSTTSWSGYNMQNQNQSRNIGSGILGGAASGAAIGSLIPGVGTAIGAAAGGILGAL